MRRRVCATRRVGRTRGRTVCLTCVTSCSTRKIYSVQTTARLDSGTRRGALWRWRGRRTSHRRASATSRRGRATRRRRAAETRRWTCRALRGQPRRSAHGGRAWDRDRPPSDPEVRLCQRDVCLRVSSRHAPEHGAFRSSSGGRRATRVLGPARMAHPALGLRA